MRILVAIPHYFDAEDRCLSSGVTATLSQHRIARVEGALASCISAASSNTSSARSGHHRYRQPERRRGEPEVRGVEGRHRRLHDARPAPFASAIVASPLAPLYTSRPTPNRSLLGFEAAMRSGACTRRIGDYDYYCYLEDDLVVTDPWMFAKLLVVPRAIRSAWIPCSCPIASRSPAAGSPGKRISMVTWRPKSLLGFKTVQTGRSCLPASWASTPGSSALSTHIPAAFS